LYDYPFNKIDTQSLKPVQANISDSRSTSSTPPKITKRSPNTEQTSEIRAFFSRFSTTGDFEQTIAS